jgi:hypothetical protein
MVVRFAVGGPGQPRSSAWRLWRHTNPLKSDVFLAPRTLAGTLKISFHESGEIRDAFTKEFQLQHGAANTQGRARLVWQRGAYSEEVGAIQLYRLVFPHSELRDQPIAERIDEDAVIWIPASHRGNATFVELILTHPGIHALELGNFIPSMDGPLAQWHLPTGENFIAVARVGQLEPEALRQIQDAIQRVPADVDKIPTDGAALRLNLVIDPVGDIGTTIETAWPATIAAS